MPSTSVEQTPSAKGEGQFDAFLQRFADGFGQAYRAPILHSPSELGLDYEDVTFPSIDGTALEGWFIPAGGSNKLIICNHPMGFTRSGQPTQLDPWRSIWGSSGNGFEVDFVPDYKILHDAGYNVIAYDLRNHGHSGTGNGGMISSGIFESRDVLGSLHYARERTDTQDMMIGLFSRCLGCNSTFHAMKLDPAAFEGVRCLVGSQPIDTKTVVMKELGLAGVPIDLIDDLERRIVLKTSLDFSKRKPWEWAKRVCVPTFLYQVREDVLTVPSDVQTMFDNIPVADKKLFWIEGTTRRWDGYTFFQRQPEQILEWFRSHMA